MTQSTKPSTFQRSCDHWSERGKVEMDAFYRLAAVDYKWLAEQLPWGELLSSMQDQFGSPLRLLDVACGSGQFPNALLDHAGLEDSPSLNIKYSLLDPSQFSIDVARKKLRGPFQPAEELLNTAQQLPSPKQLYSIVWATHALYCVPPSELGLAIDRMLAVMDSAGLGFIAHASENSHYLKFHDLYLQTDNAGDALPYCKGEQVIEALRGKLDPSRLVHWAIDYEGTVSLEDRETAELYLQRCLFDDKISLDQMLSTEPLGSYLESCMDHDSGQWRFRQRTFLIFYGDTARRIKHSEAGGTSLTAR